MNETRWSEEMKQSTKLRRWRQQALWLAFGLSNRRETDVPVLPGGLEPAVMTITTG
jgi:hypothetical protein